jgi:PAS domain S-box-containing protein
LVSAAVAEMTGHSPDELVGTPIHDVLHHSHADGQHYPRHECPIFTACQEGVLQQAEDVFWRKDGTRFSIGYMTTPIVLGGQIVGGIVVVWDLECDQAARAQIRRALELLQGSAGGMVVRPLTESLPVTQPANFPDGFSAGLPPNVSRNVPAPPIGSTAAWQAVMHLAHRVAPVATTVLLQGESGTGKELVARAIHDASQRCHKPLVTVNCGAIPAGLVESDLFGQKEAESGDAARGYVGADPHAVVRARRPDDRSLLTVTKAEDNRIYLVCANRTDSPFAGGSFVVPPGGFPHGNVDQMAPPVTRFGAVMPTYAQLALTRQKLMIPKVDLLRNRVVESYGPLIANL